MWPGSEFDLLVEFEPDAITTLFDMARIEIELSSLMDEGLAHDAAAGQRQQ